jgi:hypothetical protein
MLLNEWDWDEAKEVWQEEAMDEGIREGKKWVADLIEKGLSLAEIDELAKLERAKAEAHLKVLHARKVEIARSLLSLGPDYYEYSLEKTADLFDLLPSEIQ